MSPTTMARMFETLFTTKEPGKGTGLGLATVYGLVKQGRGWVWATSQLGAGTSFEILIPEAEVGRAATPTTGTILLVDDEASLRRVIERMLRGAGHSVLVA